jgi:hypothetical protein
MMNSAEQLRGRVSASLLLIALLAAPAAAMAAGDAGDLLRKMAPKTPATHAFVEVRQSRLLRRPSVSAGTLEYRGPGQLVKSVRKPLERRFEVDGTVARLSQGTGPVRNFDLGNVPELRAIFAGISGILGGDEAAIRKVFNLSLEERGSRWTLRMVPLDTKVLGRIRALEVRGNANGTQCIDVLEAGGTTSTMVLVDDHVAMPTTDPTAWVESKCTST